MPPNLRSFIVRGVRVAIALTAMAAALSPAAGQAFTLIQPVTKLYVNPTAGYTTSLVQVRGTQTIGGTCTGIPLTFTFLFDSAALWSRNVSGCISKAWDSGWSPYQKPPVPPTVGKHVISLTVTNPANGAKAGTASYSYSIYAAPASPRAQPTPTPTPTPDCSAIPVPAGCPSPTAKACPAAMLPPGGTGGWADNLIAALMVGAALPIAGLALFGPQTLLAEARRRRRFLTLFGLSALAVLALNCTFPTGSTSQPPPGVAAAPSPSTTPSSCSA
ncbi:MAG TPA: hypothetical protein VGV88_10035 [Candidatus Dormibacteraeota bacterium]|nr:hypothetical protein [Candidatus Dormibacteraeota bacterium]